MKDEIYVYDLTDHTFRKLSSKSNRGILLFDRRAIDIITDYYLVCGFFIFGNDGIIYLFDVQSDKIIIEEHIFLELFRNHISDFHEFNMKNAPAEHIFSIQYLCLIKKVYYKENPDIEDPFATLCNIIVDNPKTQHKFVINGKSLLLPTTYSELCEFAQTLLKITNYEYLDQDYAKNFKYLIDALINNYHINMDNHDIESAAYKVINLSIKALEE